MFTSPNTTSPLSCAVVRAHAFQKRIQSFIQERHVFVGSLLCGELHHSAKKRRNVYSNTTGNEKKNNILLRKKANFRSYTKNKALWVVGEPCTNTLPATKFPYYLPPLLHKSLKNFIRVPWQATTPISFWDALNHFESLKPFFISRRHFIDIETCHWI